MSGMYNTFYDIGKSTLWGIKKDTEQAPRLVLSFRDGNPRFVAYTGEQGSIINFPSDYPTMMAVLKTIKAVANGENGNNIRIKAMGSVWKDGAPVLGEKRLVSTLNIGKSKEGVVYIYLEEEGKPKTVFCFNKSEWHEFLQDNKEPMGKAELSKMFAEGYATLISNVLANAMTKYTEQAFTQGTYKPYEIENGKLGGNGKPVKTKEKKVVELDTDEYEEDIPF